MATPDIAPAMALEPKTKLSGKVLKTTLAGALVDVGQSIPGVIHISQLSKDTVNKVEDVVREGQTVEVWVRRIKKDRIAGGRPADFLTPSLWEQSSRQEECWRYSEHRTPRDQSR